GRWWRYKWITFHPSLTFISRLATRKLPDHRLPS
ncbi:transferase, partial [Yersinia pestis]|nr:transferase [Yersinia pestis]MRO66822.1 transferase [Yersinia pestis]MRP49576.1 transferase [Yersinia pestis]MRP99229.1 transferase [Yersinia pestis]